MRRRISRFPAVFFDAPMVKWWNEAAGLCFAAAGRAGSLADALCFHRSDNWGLSLHIFMVRLVLSVDMDYFAGWTLSLPYRFGLWQTTTDGDCGKFNLTLQR
jgi:hypothetical protein